MTTQYFLHRPGKPCPTCHRDTVESVIQIGHSAGGWVFVWRGWAEPEGLEGRPLTSPGRWRAYLTEAVQGGAVIKDEYGKEVHLGDFITMVALARLGFGDELPLRHSDERSDGFVNIDGDDFAFRDIG